MKKDLLSCMDITRADFERIISLAAELKEGRGKPARRNLSREKASA